MGISNGIFQQYWINVVVFSLMVLFAAATRLLVPIYSPLLPLLFLIVGALVMAPVLASFMGEWLAKQFYPSSVEAGPPYSMAEAKRKQGAFEEAYQAYAGIARDFPGEFEALVAMLEISTENLKDLGLAQRTLASGLQDLTEAPDRQRLHRIFDALMGELKKGTRPEEPLQLDPFDPN